MDYRKLAKGLFFTGILAILIYFDIAKWHSGLLGLILALFYFFFIASGAQSVLAKYFDLSLQAFRIKILGIFLGLTTLSLLAEFEIIFFRFSALAIALAFFVNSIIYIILEQIPQKEDGPPEIENESLAVVEEVPPAKIGLLLYLILALYGFYLLFSSRTGAVIASPWQTISPKFIYIFLFSTLILGLLIFSKLKAKLILLLLVIHAFLLFSYLPLTHQLIYGADGWRHMATESGLMTEKPLDLVVYGSQSFLNKLNLGQFSYSQLWGVSVIFARLFNLTLLRVTAWLDPIAWAIILPILLFEIGRALNFNKKNSLFLAWLGLLPFALQAGGAFTLPVNWGFLAWLFFNLLIIKRLAAPNKGQLLVLTLLAVPLLFGYALFSVLMILEWAVAEILIFKKMANFKLKNLIAVLAVGLILPIIELLAGYSKFVRINMMGQIKQFIGNLSSFYLATGPRPHDIATGNLIFNQIPSYAFVENALTAWKWWLVLFMILFLAGVVFGLIYLWKSDKAEEKWLVIIVSGLLLNYFICLYLLGGDHTISRRLDAVVAVLLLIVFFYSWTKFVFTRSPQLLGIIVSVIFFGSAITASYSLGPDTYAVSTDQYQAMNYVWLSEQNFSKSCVLADTYPLLALEEISGKEIIGGGFPIDQNFSQPERVEFFNQMQKNINNDLLKNMFDSTGADHCWFLGDTEIFKKQGLLNGSGYKLFGDSALLRYNLK